MRSSSSSPKGSSSIDPTRAVTFSLSPVRFIRARSSSIIPGSRSTAVIVPSRCRASTSVCRPVPQPMSATRSPGPVAGRNPKARMVCSSPPGPCRSRARKKSAMRVKSNSKIGSLFSLFIIGDIRAVRRTAETMFRSCKIILRNGTAKSVRTKTPDLRTRPGASGEASPDGCQNEMPTRMPKLLMLLIE